MAIKNSKDKQLFFEFDTSDREVKFITVRGQCKCGYLGEYKKADVVLEMTVPCPKCGAVIIIK